MNNYRIVSQIGSGAYSTVYRAIDLVNGNWVAVKIITSERMHIKYIMER
jgi:serine/threonine protein kinase